MTTADQVLEFLHSFDLKREANGWRCNSPLRPGANSHSFRLLIDDDGTGEHGTFYDHRSGEKGSLYELARQLNIRLPERGKAENTHRAFKDLDEYARAHGTTRAVFEAAKWKEVVRQGRPALQIPTASGIRWRFLDGKEPYYKSVEGYQRCWFGLKTAIEQAHLQEGPIVFCNGEASVVVAHSYGIAACTVTAGEKAKIPDPLLKQLKESWTGKIIVAFDCDETGHQNGAALVEFLKTNGYEARAIDLGLEGTGDLADFCRLHGQMAVCDLEKCPELPAPKAVDKPAQPSISISWSEASAQADQDYDGPIDPARSKALIIPWRNVRKFGGMAMLLEEGNVLFLAAPTGQAKTSAIETICDSVRQKGHSGIMWGPEIESRAYVHRAVQRHGGPSYNEIRIHKLWRQLQEQGMPPDLRDELLGDLAPGQSPLLSKDRVQQARAIKEEIDAWPGTLYWISRMELTVEEIVAAMLKTKQLADPRYPVDFAILDYAQLARGENSAEGIRQNLDRFKSFCGDEGLKGIIASQVTKSGSMAANSSGYIDLEDLNYARGDIADVVITFFRKHEYGSDHGALDSIANVNVAKNRLGSTGVTTLALHPTRDIWIDTQKANIDRMPDPEPAQIPF